MLLSQSIQLSLIVGQERRSSPYMHVQSCKKNFNHPILGYWLECGSIVCHSNLAAQWPPSLTGAVLRPDPRPNLQPWQCKPRTNVPQLNRWRPMVAPKTRKDLVTCFKFLSICRAVNCLDEVKDSRLPFRFSAAF